MAVDVQVIVQDESRQVVSEAVDVQVVSVMEDQQVVVEEQVTQVVSVGEQGPAGAQGLTGAVGPSGGAALTVTAGAALSGHTIVYLDASEKAQYAGNDTAAHAQIMLGMTLGAAALDAPVNVQRSGEVTEPSWSWVLEQPVYLGAGGQITQMPPVSPALFQRVIGFPMSATKLYLSFREPIFI